MSTVKEGSVFLKILVWAEVIISARILMFALPVFASKVMGNHPSYSLDDWFLASFSIPAFFFFVVGIASLLGHHLWRLLQVAIILITCFMSATFIVMVVRTQQPFSVLYLFPALVAVAVLVYLLSLKKQPHTSS